MKTLLLVLLLAVGVSAQTTTYDKFTGTTIRSSKFLQVTSNVAIMAEGRAAKDQYNLIFEVQSPDWQFIRQCTIYMLVDEERMEFPCRRYKSSANAAFRRVTVTEIVYVPMNGEKYAKVFSAKQIQMRAGTYEFQLKDKHVQELRKVLP